MSYLIMVVLGLSFGVLCASANIPKVRVLPLIATFVVISGAALVLSVVPLPGVDPANFYVFAPTTLAGALLSAPVLWKEHPLLAGLGYLGRLRISLSHSRMLRDTYGQRDVQDLDSAHSRR